MRVRTGNSVFPSQLSWILFNTLLELTNLLWISICSDNAKMISILFIKCGVLPCNWFINENLHLDKYRMLLEKNWFVQRKVFLTHWKYGLGATLFVSEVPIWIKREILVPWKMIKFDKNVFSTVLFFLSELAKTIFT